MGASVTSGCVREGWMEHHNQVGASATSGCVREGWTQHVRATVQCCTTCMSISSIVCTRQTLTK